MEQTALEELKEWLYETSQKYRFSPSAITYGSVSKKISELLEKERRLSIEHGANCIDSGDDLSDIMKSRKIYNETYGAKEE